ncbi:MAG: O-antigen ligase family protein [Bacteroidetes bacterium]|nr:O-antigen ligase family protein [Bacteroidota bacterium]
MIEKIKLKWVYIFSILFVMLNVVLILKEYFFISILIPVAIIIGILYIFFLDKLIFLIVFLTPVAINVRNIDMGLGISLPTEPLLFGVLILFILRGLYKNNFDSKVLKHPVSIFILISLVWIFLTSLTSEIRLVSFKFLIARLWFIIPIYFIGIQLFRKFGNIKTFSWVYVIPLLGIIAYTVRNHALQGFDEEAGHWVMTPFYNDHTAWGAILTIFIPVFIGFSFNRQSSKTLRLVALLITVILLVALYLSFSRAAWISLAVAALLYLIIVFRIKFRWILLTVALLVGIFFTFKWQILDALEKNKQDTSTNFIEHVQSIVNISSDASNLERINRWQSAIRMFHERPFFGWGPGTYQFLYAPFQRTKEKTIISTNFGDLGNAHSEYIGPLAESGVIGMLTMVGIVISFFITGLRIYKKAQSREVKMLSLVTVLSLSTYFVHGLLNNFLDTDKLSIPVWGFIAILVALDVYHLDRKDEARAGIQQVDADYPHDNDRPKTG